MRRSLGLSSAFGGRAHGLQPFTWHGIVRTAEPSELGYERLLLPGTLDAPTRRSLRSLAAAAGLRYETFGPKACRRVLLALQAECSCCVNALSYQATDSLSTAQLREALQKVFGFSPLSDDDITCFDDDLREVASMVLGSLLAACAGVSAFEKSATWIPEHHGPDGVLGRQAAFQFVAMRNGFETGEVGDG
ncbi:unnamed protein product [Symbiodinium microadriaticum]|nr:unnamed protein product [Symbiodinium sp. KB8]CAE7906825.1 unnamed protein product [Symbiodinium microadriaticum]